MVPYGYDIPFGVTRTLLGIGWAPRTSAESQPSLPLAKQLQSLAYQLGCISAN